MSRAGILCVCALALLLVSDHAPRVENPGAAEVQVGQAQPGDDSLHARLSEWNPQLSSSEARRIAASVVRCGAEQGLAAELVAAVIRVESGARPWARSRKGAIGLMQVMPHMVDDMDLAGNLTTIEKNVEAGCRILADNIRRLGEDDGISAYFWGSEIRGVAYLARVKQARAGLERPPSS